MYRIIKQTLEFLLVICVFFVGDYSVGSLAILPILVFLALIVFISNRQLITSRELITLSVIVVYLIGYFIAHSGATEQVSYLIPILLPFLFLLSCVLTSQNIPKLISRYAQVFIFLLLLCLLLGLDPLPFGRNIEYRMYAFLFIISIIYRNRKLFSPNNAAYLFYSLYGYSRGGILTFVFLNSLFSKLILFSTLVLFLILGTIIIHLEAIPVNYSNLRSLYFDLENASESTRIILYQTAISEVKGFSVKELFFGNPQYFAGNFYSHNVVLDLTITFGIFPTLLLLIGTLIFIIKTLPLIFSPRTNYFTCYFYAVCVGSFISGGMTENWAIPVAGLLGFARRNITYKNLGGR
jgi:hypothetical protein